MASPYASLCTSHQALNVISQGPSVRAAPWLLRNYKWLQMHIYCSSSVAADLPSKSPLHALLTGVAALQATTLYSLVVTRTYIWLLTNYPSLPAIFPTSGSIALWQASEIFIWGKKYTFPTSCLFSKPNNSFNFLPECISNTGKPLIHAEVTGVLRMCRTEMGIYFLHLNQHFGGKSYPG